MASERDRPVEKTLQQQLSILLPDEACGQTGRCQYPLVYTLTPQTRKRTYFSVQCFLISERSLFSGMFPGYARLPIRSEQYVHKDWYGLLAEWSSQTKTEVLGQKPVPAPL